MASFRWQFSELYSKFDREAWTEVGTGFLQASCEVTVIDYGHLDDAPKGCCCRLNGKDVGPEATLTESVCASTVEELLVGFPPGFFDEPPKDCSVRWINVEGICGDIYQFLLTLAQSEFRHTFNNIVNQSQSPMGIMVEAMRDGDTNFMMVTKVPSLHPEAEESHLHGNQELYRVGSPIDLERITYLLHVPADGACGTLISFQEGSGSAKGDVYDDVREEIKVMHSLLQMRNVQYLLVQLVLQSIMSTDCILQFLKSASFQLEKAILDDPNNKELSAYARKLKQRCGRLNQSLAPLEKTLSDITFTKSEFESVTGQFLPVWYSMCVQGKDLCEVLNQLERKAGELEQVYTEKLVERAEEMSKKLAADQVQREKNETFVNLILSIFTPLTFIAGMYGMNFSKPNGDPGMPELMMGWRLSNGSDPASVVVQDGLTGYELFWILCSSATVAVISFYMSLGILPGPIGMILLLCKTLKRRFSTISGVQDSDPNLGHSISIYFR